MNGNLWTWGFNGGKQLGTTSEYVTTPTQITSNMLTVQPGPVSTIALDKNRYMWGMGQNGNGQFRSN